MCEGEALPATSQHGGSGRTAPLPGRPGHGFPAAPSAWDWAGGQSASARTVTSTGGELPASDPDPRTPSPGPRGTGISLSPSEGTVPPRPPGVRLHTLCKVCRPWRALHSCMCKGVAHARGLVQRQPCGGLAWASGRDPPMWEYAGGRSSASAHRSSFTRPPQGLSQGRRRPPGGPSRHQLAVHVAADSLIIYTQPFNYSGMATGH